MLFALVMWDIIYMPIEGVFETPYQRQPLDLAEDSFSVVRGPEIRQRLLEIEATGGLHLIRQTDDRERERKTWAVGCRWQDYAQDDLLEIAEVGESGARARGTRLASVCSTQYERLIC